MIRLGTIYLIEPGRWTETKTRMNNLKKAMPRETVKKKTTKKEAEAGA